MVKGVNNVIKPYITSVSIAYWFMDDGNKADYRDNGSKGLIFNTHSFTDHEVNLQITILNDPFYAL